MAEDTDKPDLAAGIPTASIPPDGMLGGTLGGEPVILVRVDGTIRAYGGRCTHLGAPLDEGLCSGGLIRCPWHHARFDGRTGEAVDAPAFDPLPRYAVHEAEGIVTVGEPVAARPAARRTFEGHSEPGIVILGGGCAGYAAAHELRRRGHEGPVSLVSDDESPLYDRTLLTKDYLEGRFGADRLPIAAATLSDLGVTRVPATAASIAPAERRLHLADGRTLPYTHLLIATGAEANRLDVPGGQGAEVRPIRSLADARAVMARLVPGTKVVVVGSSFIGLETAASIRARGFDVTVVTPEHAPMRSVLGPALSTAILALHREKGVGFRLGARVEGIGDGAVRLADGTALPGDVVVVGIGVTPRVALAEAAGLATDDGIVVDASLRTSDPDIFAAGDVARWPDPRFGRIRVEHWCVAGRHGQAAARAMTGEAAPFAAVPFFWSKHFDLGIRYLGHATDWDEEVVEGDLARKDALIRLKQGGADRALITIGRDRRSLAAEQAWEARP